MQKLVQGIHNFQTNYFASHRALFERLSDGQKPMAIFISCSDSRVIPSLITQTDPGELFILRNAGNIIPPFGASNGGEAATIEYGISVLKIENIIICGHSQCGAMTSLLDRESVAQLPAVADWLQHAEATRRIMIEKYSHLAGQELLTATVQENVLMQLENLRTHPAVAAAVARGALSLHGWVYKFETGQVFAYDPVAVEFLPIVKIPSEPALRERSKSNGKDKSNSKDKSNGKGKVAGKKQAVR
jgi:carbonic anhydrase